MEGGRYWRPWVAPFSFPFAVVRTQVPQCRTESCASLVCLICCALRCHEGLP